MSVISLLKRGVDENERKLTAERRTLASVFLTALQKVNFLNGFKIFDFVLNFYNPAAITIRAVK
ncbi:MAG: hypothetical protein GU362_05480 [Thaumarchaeota archaeon]|jgi:hypothetical protein|nr:hypothetical protein [Nitrososphaerota archaeon]